MHYRLSTTDRVIDSAALHSRLRSDQWAVDWGDELMVNPEAEALPSAVDGPQMTVSPTSTAKPWVLTDSEGRRVVARPVTRGEVYADTLFREPAEAVLAKTSKYAQFGTGDVVSYGSGTTQRGVVQAVYTSAFDWPVDNDASGDEGIEEVDASTDDPVYIVSRLSGGAGVYAESEVESGSLDDIDDPDPEAVSEANLAQVYSDVDDPMDLGAFQAALRARTGRAELLNIRGVDDPEVGFSSWPNGWDRGSLLKFWTTVGASWTSCNTRMTPHMGPAFSKRFCSAAKDELTGTERWRGRF